MGAEHLRVDLILSGSRAKASHDADTLQHHTTLWPGELRLLGEYGLTEHTAVQAVVPVRVIDTHTRYTDLAGNPVDVEDDIHHRDETLVGLGDVQLLLHVGGGFGGVAIGGRFGVSAPTGEVHENPFRLGDAGLPHQHVQFGTGTVDPILGIDAGRAFGAWSVAGFGQIQLPLYEGAQGFQAGARLLGGATVTRGAWRLGFTAAHETAERWDGRKPVEDGNLGRTDLFLGPGVTIPFGTDYSASLDVAVRVFGDTQGAQLEMPVVVTVSVGRLFHLESGEHGEHEEHEEEHAEHPADVADLVLAGEARPLVPVVGKWTVFDFWATWCESCGVLDARLRDLAHDREDVAVRRVNIVDLDSPISKAELVGVTTLPRVRVVDPRGTVVYEASGTPTEIMDAIAKLITR